MIRQIQILALLGALFSTTVLARAQNQPPVTLTEDTASYTLSNGVVTARIEKTTGCMRSLVYRGIETMDGIDRSGGFWSHHPNAESHRVDKVTIDPKTNGGERAEISIKGFCDGKPFGSGPGGSAVADVEIRYALGRGVSGIYTYTILEHKPEYPAMNVGEARYVDFLNDDVFDWMTVDERRNKESMTKYDWNHGTPLNMKEVRRLNSGIYKGVAEHKYDYSAIQFDTPAFGWSSTKYGIGSWFVNPSCEYLSGGATKVELTAHRDATFTNSLTASADPVTLNYWRGSHYGGSDCEAGPGEEWTRVIGPFLIYCNSGTDHDALWKDALAQAAKEAAAWPYDWVSGVDYPHKSERATVSGQLALRDPQSSQSLMPHLLVGLAHPDYTPTGGGSGVENGKIDWQMDAKYYEFWVRGEDHGRFTIPNVRPGTYTLHAIADGVLGEFALENVKVEPGKPIDLGSLTWTPVRYGRQIWDIGIPNRSASEFLHGDHYWVWGLYKQYPKDFPSGVSYVVGKSDFHKDWNYAQVPRDETDTGPGKAATWAVTFDLPNAPHGKAILRLALASSSAKYIDVTVNDVSVGGTGPLPDTGTVRRDGIQGYWRERDVAFDASKLKAGTNVLTLTVPAAVDFYGVQYDYLRLEIDENAVAATR